MKPAPVAYARPTSLTEALELLAGTPDAKVLAGGQSLVPLLNMRLAAPTLLVDINRLPGLDHVMAAPDGVHVGALARHSAVLADAAARRTQPLLADALSHVAHATIRNRGTTVGSIVHADAAAEMPAVLAVLDGHVEVASVRGRRRIEARDLVVGPLQSSLEHDEIALEACFPALDARAGTAFTEISRRQGDYALCGVAAVVALDEDGAVASARCGYLAVHETPAVVDLPALVGARGPLGDDVVAAAADLALGVLDVEGDIHGTAAYRRHLVRVLTARALRTAHDDAVTRTTTTRTTAPTPTTGGTA